MVLPRQVACDPNQALSLRDCRMLLAQALRDLGGRESKSCTAIAHDAAQSRKRLCRLRGMWRIGGHGNDPRIETAEEGPDELQAGRVEQHCPFTACAGALQVGCDRACIAMQLRE